MRLIGLLLAAVVVAIALWLVFINPRLENGGPAPGAVSGPAATAPENAPENTLAQNQMADEAAEQAAAAAKARAVQAKAVALAAQHAAEAAEADAIEQNMTPAENRLNEDYAAQVGDTRPTASDASNTSTTPDQGNR